MGMKDRLGRVAQKAKDVGEQVKSEAAGARDDAKSAARARIDSAVGAVTGKADAARNRATSLRAGFDDLDLETLLERLPVPEPPVSSPWRLSLSTVITAGEDPPKGAGLLLRQLDRLGAIDIGPEEVGFDEATAKWPKVRAIRTRTLDGMIEKLSSESIVDTVSNFLPPVPGRAWACEKASSVLFTLWALAAELAIEDPEAGRRQFVCEIEYQGWVRTKEAQLGFFTGPCMALAPAVDDLFRAEAAARGIAVEEAPSSAGRTAEQRAAWLREKQRAILARRERTRDQIEA
ncbi:hypothetical protein GCM10027447_31840 [Glycomyces halotolerans]